MKFKLNKDFFYEKRCYLLHIITLKDNEAVRIMIEGYCRSKALHNFLTAYSPHQGVTVKMIYQILRRRQKQMTCKKIARLMRLPEQRVRSIYMRHAYAIASKVFDICEKSEGSWEIHRKY